MAALALMLHLGLLSSLKWSGLTISTLAHLDAAGLRGVHFIALRFLRKAIDQCGMPKKINIDKSGANAAAVESYNAEHHAGIELRQVKYLNNIVEQDHRAIKRMTRPMSGFKSFWSASITLAGIELMHMIRKGQLKGSGQAHPAQQFYSLAS